MENGRENARCLRNMSQYPGIITGLKLYGVLQQRKHVIWTTRLRAISMNIYIISIS